MVKANTKIISKGAGEFSFTKENNKILKGIVETLASLIDECQIIITPDDLCIKAMDPSKICLMHISIPTDAFELFTAKECRVGINLNDLDKILKRCNANDKLEVSYKTEDKKLKIKMTRGESMRARTFSLAELELDTEDVSLDNLSKIQYPSIWTIDPDLIVEAIKDAEIYAEVINIKAAKKGITIDATGQIGELKYELGIEDLIDFETKKTATGAYSLDFLKKIFKLVPITEKLVVSILSDNPLKLEFSISEGGTILIFLAPRVEEAEFEEEEDMDFETTEIPEKEPKQEAQPPEEEAQEGEEGVDTI